MRCSTYPQRKGVTFGEQNYLRNFAVSVQQLYGSNQHGKLGTVTIKVPY